MNYIIDRIVYMVSSHEPEINGETMIMINGFENLQIYNQIAKKISDKYKNSRLSIGIKLAGKKWIDLQKNCDTTVVQSMLQNDWIAEKESITFYLMIMAYSI